ncbi:MAG: radical SAM protein [Phycisphaerae bacterium]|jgi:radical SAM superfamily enzyme YgiQ (UPF0313 family)|nr:radical SAM protein [Phycisphaerae bacterium]
MIHSDAANPARVLLLEAPYHYGAAQSLVGAYFPLGVGYLAAYLRQHGCPVRIFQPPARGGFDPALRRVLADYDPALVGISVMTPSYPEAVRLCEMVKKHSACKTVLGGHHVSAEGAEVLKQSPTTDFAAVGEGEQTLLELAEAVGSGREEFSSIDGLHWRDANGQVRQNAPRGLIEDLDSLPLPARDMVDMSRYRVHSYIDFGKRSATMISSRGCPFRCIFCSSRLTMGNRYRYRSAESVLAEIRSLVADYGVDHIVFEDDTLTLRRDRMRDICRGMLELPRRPSWYCLSRVDTLDYPLAKLMRKAGCRMVNFGIESGSPEILEKIGKRISLERAVQTIGDCTRAGIRTQCTFIVGFPFDTPETLKATFDAARRIKPTIAIFFPLTPYPGTPVFEQFMSPEQIPKTVSQWRGFLMTGPEGGISVNPGHTAAELRQIASRWNRRFHLRPGQLLRLLRTVAGPEEAIRLARSGLYVLSSLFNRA